MAHRSNKEIQKRLNRFFRNARLKYPRLEVDGRMGSRTKVRIRQAKYYLGYKGNPTSVINSEFEWRLWHPNETSPKFDVSAADVKRGKARRRARRRALRSPSWSWLWGGCRGVTNEVIHIVGNRAPITSRKRTETYGNPGSDHHTSQRYADAVDFGIPNAYSLAREIARKMTGRDGEWAGDYDSFYVTRKGVRFRVQIIAGTHGTGPHLHVGVRRA